MRPTAAKYALVALVGVSLAGSRSSAAPPVQASPLATDLASRRQTIIDRELAGRAEVILGEVLVRWRGRRRSTIGHVGGRRVSARVPIDTRSEVLRVDDKTIAATAALLAELRSRPDVEIAEPHRMRRIYRKPTDPHYAVQWYLRSVQLEGAWDVTTGSRSVVVAIVDTGIRRNHPDLAGRLLRGYDFITNASNAGDGNGRDSDPTDNGKRNASSSMIHGTHVAGIIGATTNNNRGIAGVDWRCQLLPLRALGVNAGNGADADIVAAIRWAAGLPVDGAPPNKTPARVINLSFGGPGEGKLLTTTIKEVIRRGVVVVGAAGNDNSDTSNIYPAAVPGVVTVAASTYENKRAPYSNYGKTVDVIAPGGTLSKLLPFSYKGEKYKAGILSTMWDDVSNKFEYYLYEGTSQAAPVVAGVVSLMIAVNPKLRPPTVLDILKATASPKGRCAEGCGAGLVNASAAIKRAKASKHPSTSGSAANGQQYTIHGYGCTLGGGDGGVGLTAGTLLLALFVVARRRTR